jgi:hypothetical protein
MALSDVPDPRAGGVNEIVFVFSQAATGFDWRIRLTRRPAATSLLPGSATFHHHQQRHVEAGQPEHAHRARGHGDLRLTWRAPHPQHGGESGAGDTERDQRRGDQRGQKVDQHLIEVPGEVHHKQLATRRKVIERRRGVQWVDIIAALRLGIT